MKRDASGIVATAALVAIAVVLTRKNHEKKIADLEIRHKIRENEIWHSAFDCGWNSGAQHGRTQQMLEDYKKTSDKK